MVEDERKFDEEEVFEDIAKNQKETDYSKAVSDTAQFVKEEREENRETGENEVTVAGR